ncbi:Integral membrane protein 2C [Cricetulus griseus]|uniref:Integral membrane protein 2 n=1 Tax=Cricetulus griseus TaxID=10029 RepID=G3I480_CRIGR|nr:Integral membrane protein 2C [Cricetulus griseus]
MGVRRGNMSIFLKRYQLRSEILFLAQIPRDNLFHCGVLYEDSLSSQIRTRMELEEDVKIYLEKNYERINVPVPQFGSGDLEDIIHDFQRGLTAYHNISLDKCYIIELNTTIVLPPRNFWELLVNVKRGTYLPQTYIIQEEMVVMEYVSDKEALCSFIYHLNNGKDTYRLQCQAMRRWINKCGARTAMTSATLRTPLWWRRSSVGWCEAFPPGSPLPSSFSPWPLSGPPPPFA